MRLMREEIYEKATTAAGNGGNSLTELTPGNKLGWYQRKPDTEMAQEWRYSRIPTAIK